MTGYADVHGGLGCLEMQMGCPSRMIGIIEYADGISMEDQGDWRCRCPWIRMTGDANEMSMD